MRKPLTPDAVAELNSVLRRAAERMERRRRASLATDEDADRLAREVAAANEGMVGE